MLVQLLPVIVAAFSPASLPAARPAYHTHSRAVVAATPHASRSGALVAAAAAARNVVVTDMDETLISKKSTGYVIKFLVQMKCFLRLLCTLPLALVLIPLSKVQKPFDGRALAVRLMYWLAFRGMRVDKAQRVASDTLCEAYVRDLQDPAASAVLEADEAVILTASPTFMARPWLTKYMRVKSTNVYGAELEERNGRFTGRTGDLPMGQKKVELFEANEACVAEGAATTGYGDHPTDVPFLQACSRGVLVEELEAAESEGCEYVPAVKLSEERIEQIIEG